MSRTQYTLSDFDYYLPREFIAKYPANPKDTSRLIVLDTRNKKIFHDSFIHIDKYFPDRTLLVINDTKVFYARLQAIRTRDKRPFEFLLLSPYKGNLFQWRTLVSPLKRLKAGDIFETRIHSYSFRCERSDSECFVATRKYSAILGSNLLFCQ